MKRYLVQIASRTVEVLEREDWQGVTAETPQDAIVEAARPLIKAGLNPDYAYVVLRMDEDGIPVAVQGYSLKVERTI